MRVGLGGAGGLVVGGGSAQKLGPGMSEGEGSVQKSRSKAASGSAGIVAVLDAEGVECVSLLDAVWLPCGVEGFTSDRVWVNALRRDGCRLSEGGRRELEACCLSIAACMFVLAMFARTCGCIFRAAGRLFDSPRGNGGVLPLCVGLRFGTVKKSGLGAGVPLRLCDFRTFGIGTELSTAGSVGSTVSRISVPAFRRRAGDALSRDAVSGAGISLVVATSSVVGPAAPSLLIPFIPFRSGFWTPEVQVVMSPASLLSELLILPLYSTIRLPPTKPFMHPTNALTLCVSILNICAMTKHSNSSLTSSALISQR